MKISYLITVCVLFFCVHLYAQKGKIINGRVTGAGSDNLSGVTVTEINTHNSVTADASGKYSIRLTQNKSALVFSYVGYAAREIPVDPSSSTLDVTLENSARLSEVVVTAAFGIKQRKKTLGYTVQEVSSSDLQQGRENNFVDALQGKVSGVNISSSGGAPGSGTDIVIRGISSLTPRPATPL